MLDVAAPLAQVAQVCAPMNRFRTNLDGYRLGLFSILGLVSAGCAGKAESDTGDETAPAPGGAARAAEGTLFPAHLRCEGETPSQLGVGLRACANGIIHRPAQEPCDDCAPVFTGYSSFGDRCGTEEDCEPGALCVASREITDPEACQLSFRTFFACQTRTDECGADAQCEPGRSCIMVDGSRRCEATPECLAPPPGPVPGRPFQVAGEARIAGVRASRDWCGEGFGEATDMDPPRARCAAAYWLSAALMEHASIAAFARFSLQLLQLGAPLDLTRASHQAMRDETEHARRCFILASRYAGAPLGPAPLAMTGAFEEQSLAEIARLAFREGCVGETCAALEASEALEHAADAMVQETLALIAGDERRHAELAWRFLAWALERDSTGEVARVVQSELDRVRSEIAASPRAAARIFTDEDAALSRHGILSAHHLGELRQAALISVVLPCAERLLAAPRSASKRSVQPRDGAPSNPAATPESSA